MSSSLGDPFDTSVAEELGGSGAADAPVELVGAPGEFIATIDEPDGSIAEVVYEADPVLLAAVEQARAALAEITPAASIGEVVGHAVEGEHVLSLFFASTLAGYPDWHWTATLSRVSDTDEPVVLEVEMLPGEDSVLSPAWVPWADRLTQDALIDDSENEFDDDDDDESADDGDLDDDGDRDDSDDDDDDDPDDDDDDPDDDDDDDDDGDLDDEEVAALALRRDRDGIDIDAIAERGFEVAGDGSTGDGETTLEVVELSAAFAEVGRSASGAGVEADSTEEAGPEVAATAPVDPDAGSAFDATDDFADAGDIEGRHDVGRDDEAEDRAF